MKGHVEKGLNLAQNLFVQCCSSTSTVSPAVYGKECDDFWCSEIKGKRLQDAGNVTKSVTAVLTVTQLPFRPVAAPLLG